MLLPNIWGQGGALFAFSGMDGETSWEHPLVGSTVDAGRGIVFHSEGAPMVRFGVKLGDVNYVGDDATPFTSITDDAVTGGCIVSHIFVQDCSFKVEYTYANKDVLLVRITAEAVNAPVEIFIKSKLTDGETQVINNRIYQTAKTAHYLLACSALNATADQSGRINATLNHVGDSVIYTWAYSSIGPKHADALANAGLQVDFDQLIDRQINYFKKLPVPKVTDPKQVRTYYKAASVLKVNCYTPEGDIPFKWTTPDRWPHRHMWIWDSALHAVGLRHISGEWAEDAIKAVLSQVRDDGYLGHTMTPDGMSDIIQPPIVGWASWKVYQKTHSQEFLSYVYPRLCKMIKHDITARDTDKNGLAEWEGGFASGMDNSPRFDQPVKDAVDLNSYIVNDMHALARIAKELSKDDEAKSWEKRAQELSERVNDLLWDKETGFYYDNDFNGKLIKIKTEAGFTPLFAGICSKEQAEALVKHLTNPSEFWRKFPVASVSADEPTFSDNMWRGPVWINMNYFFIEGLKNYGFNDIADKLKKRTIEEISHWQTIDGVTYEFYDSEASTDPLYLHRKDKGGPQPRMLVHLGTNIRDYNWTAALYVDLVSE